MLRDCALLVKVCYSALMQLWLPQDGDPRLLAEEGKERWAAHPRKEDVFASNLGNLLRVFPRQGTAEIAKRLSTKGYLTATAAGERRYVHQFVLEAFEGMGEGRTARRRNRDRTDNRLCNLYWSTARGKLGAAEKELLLHLLRADKLSHAEIARRFRTTSSHVAYYAKQAYTRPGP